MLRLQEVHNDKLALFSENKECLFLPLVHGDVKRDRLAEVARAFKLRILSTTSFSPLIKVVLLLIYIISHKTTLLNQINRLIENPKNSTSFCSFKF